MVNKTVLAYAQYLDKNDELASYRNKFHIPKDDNGNEWVYLCGNSLGLQPKTTKNYINQELEDWAKLGVKGHFKAKKPWLSYQESLSESMAKVVGAKPIEVVVMNTLTTNLHLAMVSFYQPTKIKFKIVIESDAFPSDRYAVESQLKHYGFDPKKGLIEWKPREGEELLHIEDLEKIIREEGDKIALLMIGGVNYYTGQFFDLKKIADLGHSIDAKVGIDLAHGVGNIQPNLHASNIDFAVWCTYKYLNSGPGSLGGLFVHEKYANDKKLNRFSGWWGHNKKTRFNMRHDFDAIPGAEGWQLSNPSILSMTAIKASLDIFNEVGMGKLQVKSQKLTHYLEFLLEQFGNDIIEIITPKNTNERGCQLSIQVKKADKSLHDKLIKAYVICDWREPDVIRVAPVPLYNSFEDVYKMVRVLKSILISGK